MSGLGNVVVVAAQGVPGGTPGAILAAPIGILLFVGTVYLLLRSNLGGRRGYLVLGTSFFGFLFLMSLFWGFGAPGTPVATGPRNLPSQVSDEYVPHWTAFAMSSRVAETETYGFVRSYPEGFGEVPEGFEGTAQNGADEIRNFFSTRQFGETGPGPAIESSWAPVERRYAEAGNGFPVLAVTYQQTYQPATSIPEDWESEAPPLTPDGESVADDSGNLAPTGTEAGAVVPDGETATLFGFYDPGAVLFPSLLMAGISLVLFLFHGFLLDRDEQRERRELRALTEDEPERVPAGA